MNAEDVLKLVNAGFSKEEIMALTVSDAAQPVAPAKEPEPTPAPVEEVKKNSPSSEDVLLNRIGDLEKLIQANNRQNVEIQTPKQETADDIFRSVFGLELDNSERNVNV